MYDLGLIAIAAWVIFAIGKWGKHRHDQKELEFEQSLLQDAEECRGEGMSEERIRHRHETLRRIRNEKLSVHDDDYPS